MSKAEVKPAPNEENGYLLEHAELLCRSFEKLTGRALLDVHDDLSKLGEMLYRADFVVVSHGIEPDPVFNYANETALKLFEMSWTEFVALPSRLSAEPVHQDERARLMQTVTAQGFIDDYAGIRISKSGKRFEIKSATVWNLFDEDDSYRGQAATFAGWRFIET